MKPAVNLRPAPARGPRSSQDYNATMEEIVASVRSNADGLANQENSLAESNLILSSNSEELWGIVLGLRKQVEDIQASLVASNSIIWTSEDFASVRRLYYTVGSDTVADENKCRVETRYGQLTLPYDRVVNRFFAPVPDQNSVALTKTFVPDSIDVSVSLYDAPTTDRKRISGSPSRALDGHNQNFWLEQIEYPLSSDVDSVAIDLTVSVPETFIDQANILNVHPYPLGSLDIEKIWVSSTYAAPDTSTDVDLLPGFDSGGYRCAGYLRWHFPAQRIYYITIRMRQRSPIERNGRKLFQLGLQELGLQLVQFDKTVLDPASPLNFGASPQNNSAVIQLKAPPGKYFKTLKNFVTSFQGYTGQYQWRTPSSSTPAAGSTWATLPRATFEIHNTTNLNLTPKWSSYSAISPVDVDLAGILNPTELYVLIRMGYDSGLAMSPILESLGLTYTVGSL